jgi:hypothetical protein
MQKEVIFNLSKPIKYHDGGNPNAEAGSLKMTAPSFRMIKHAMKLKQDMMNAMTSASSKVKSSDKADDNSTSKGIEPEQVLVMLTLSDLNLGETIDSFKTIALSGCVKINRDDKDVVLTDLLLDQIDSNDFEMMMANYICFFTIASLMDKIRSAS